jgi:hypothetical protein
MPAESQVVAFRLVDAMLEDADETNPMSDPTSVECLAEGVVADLGLERPAVLGLTAEQSPLPEVLFGRLEPDELARVVAIALECEDLGARISDAVIESGVSASSAGCFITVLEDTGFVSRAMRDVGLLRLQVDQPGTDDLWAEMEAAGDQCLTENEQGLVFGTADTIPEGDS